MKRVLEGKYSFEYPSFQNVSIEAKKLINNMLEIDVTKRYSAKQCLQDPWIFK